MFGDIITSLTNWLDEVSQHWWFLLVIIAIALLDSVLPVVPSETCVIIGGVAAAGGHQELPLVIACAAIGAFVGDNLACQIGRGASSWFRRRADRKPSFATRLDWATNQIHERGGLLLITARFVPGGRTILTLSSGITRQPLVWFVSWIAVAAVIWATYASLLGFIGGAAFEDNHSIAFLVAFGGALGITVIIEGVRFVRHRLRSGAETEKSTPSR
ncbi:MAG TPA: DedA family protein [Jatrophihabitantaceae bacterium]